MIKQLLVFLFSFNLISKVTIEQKNQVINICAAYAYTDDAKINWYSFYAYLGAENVFYFQEFCEMTPWFYNKQYKHIKKYRLTPEILDLHALFTTFNEEKWEKLYAFFSDTIKYYKDSIHNSNNSSIISMP